MATIDTYVTRAFRDKVSQGVYPKNTLQEFLQSIYGNGRAQSLPVYVESFCNEEYIVFKYAVKFVAPGMFFTDGHDTKIMKEGASLFGKKQAQTNAALAALDWIVKVADTMRNVSQAPMRTELKPSIAHSISELQVLTQQLQEMKALQEERATRNWWVNKYLWYGCVMFVIISLFCRILF